MTGLVLITGGAGFIGSHLTRLASDAGYSVRVLDNLSPQVHAGSADLAPPPGVEFIKGDVTNRSDLEAAIADVATVVHLAAETGTGQSMYEIERYYRVNVLGTALLFDILANDENNVRNVVLASSRSVYGEGAYLCRSCDPLGKRCFPLPRTPSQLARRDWAPRCPDCGEPAECTATCESDALRPASIYAATKLAQEELVRVGATSLGLAHSILRFQNVFGEGQSLSNPYTGILSIFSTRIRLGLSLPIYEDGQESRDFVHVEDVTRAVLSCIQQPAQAGATLNVGSGYPTSILKMAQLLADFMGAEQQPHVTGAYRVGDIRHNFADLSALKSAFGNYPTISLEDGLERFCRWVSGQPVPPDLLEKANAELSQRNLAG
ncbi:dTDP-L-rhamnose 4-epimerase [Sphingobium sp. B2D3A]|uniref:NAD-dependent epimerase/dehydratase family protein n=1 Tax=unclassified Sphingobium TaxID=2611147 RepID=UPI00222495F5|nr:MULTISPECIES: NAD-dependent epimerase/dehydratase family protein [unclassified Sphingobium]MCW2338515.1 dTDP-L-rhamnose 4-epimerase [Sphingobium sp. B2D3A]MCW2384973.1 dTDP-L-rhamnose 4-epimerase [Sphingobium sp. B2D3D]